MEKSTFETLGRHIQSLRLARGLSLSQLAADAGIAKSNLSRLEQGYGNPTLDTIWRLSLQLQVPFGNLIAPVGLLLDDNGVQIRLIDQGKDHPAVDAYWMSCAPLAERKAEAHATGTLESVFLLSGTLDVGIEGHSKQLLAGQLHSFAADQPHLYRAGDKGATALLTIVYHQSVPL
jgi:transcriptional regulator with XRE-family HTH domain